MVNNIGAKCDEGFALIKGLVIYQSTKITIMSIKPEEERKKTKQQRKWIVGGLSILR